MTATTTKLSKTCWICGGPGPLTGEHQINRVDLADIFGPVSQANPVYLQRDNKLNTPVGSLKSKVLKSDGTLCALCNGALTQPYDLAFTEFRRALAKRIETASPGAQIRLNRLLPQNTARKMLGVHLHFAKKFGEYVMAGGAGIDLSSIAAALRAGRAHPHFYLKFGVGPEEHAVRFTGQTHMEVAHIEGRPDDVRFATFMVGYDGLIVSVMYALPGERRQGLSNSWHPSSSKILTLARFQGEPAR